MILENYELFIKNIFHKIQEFGIDVSDFEMDHIGYQTSSDEDYDRLKSECEAMGTMVSEAIVGGRRVGIYQLHTMLQYQQYRISAFELVAPKEGQICPSALEHVEFVLNEPFDSFMKKYPTISWDTIAIAQPDFPMIKLKLDKNLQVKFHLTPVLEIGKKIRRTP